MLETRHQILPAKQIVDFIEKRWVTLVTSGAPGRIRTRDPLVRSTASAINIIIYQSLTTSASVNTQPNIAKIDRILLQIPYASFHISSEKIRSAVLPFTINTGAVRTRGG